MIPELLYINSGALAYACPPIRVSQPAALDNTERYSFDEQRVIEPAKEVLCFDCQHPIEAGKGVQVLRHLLADNCPAYAPERENAIPIHTLVHSACNHASEV